MTAVQAATLKDKKLLHLPKGWVVCLLGENAHIRGRIGWKGLKQEEYTEDGPFLVAGKHIKSGKIQWDSCDHINQARFEESPEIALELGDVIFSKDGSLGNPALLDFMPGPATVNSTMMLVRCSNDALSSRYLLHVLKSDYFDTLVRERVSGSSIPHIFQRDMKDFQFPWPPLPEQQKIAGILTAVDDKLDIIARQIEATQTLKRGLMQTLFSRGLGTQDADGRWVPHTEFKDSELGEIPAAWMADKLTSHVSKVGSGVTPKGGSDSYLSAGIPLIRSQNVLVGRLSLEDVVFIAPEQHEKMRNSELAPNDVLLNITGASIGRCAVLPSDFAEGNVNQHVCIIRPENSLNAHFLCQYLNSDLGQKQVGKFQAGGNREGLNYQQIRSFDIPVPPIVEQREIAAVLGCVDERTDALTSKQMQYQTLKRGLMQKLLNGEWRVAVEVSR